MGVTISNHEFICVSVIVGGNTSKCNLGMTPFGSLSPEHYGPKRVPGGTSVPSELLSRSSPLLSPQQIYTLRACSLLVIPPPIGRMVPQGGFPTDLTELNLSGWATLVQDVAAGLQALPPRLSHDLGLQVVALLQLLEVATGVGFCCHCCNLRPCCKYMGASQPAPPTSWSQIVEQTPGYGLTSSSGGVTHPSTSMGGMPGYVVPPPGLTPPDYSIWSMPPLEASLSKGLPGSLQYRPPVGRAAQLRATLDRQAQALQAPASQAPQMAPHCASHSHLPGFSQQPHTSRLFSHRISQQGWESPLTPLPTNLWPLMVTGGRELEAEITTPGLPVTPG